VIEIEMLLFLGKQIVTLSLAAHIKLNATVHAKFDHFSLLPSSLLLSHLLLATPHPLSLRNGW
jgi:hypothetical protein